MGASPLIRFLRFLFDPRIAPFQKGLVFAALLYVVSPIDLLPGAFVPLLGWLDDAVALGLAWRLIDRALRRLD